MKKFEGEINGDGLKIAIVVSRFNELISSKLLDGAVDTLKKLGVEDNDISVAWVPGAFEIPLVAKKMAGGTYDAVITLGTIIRGDTPHFDFIASEAARGIAQVSRESGKPVIFCVLTTENIEQAFERAGAKGNKGVEAARAAIEMANLIKILK